MKTTHTILLAPDAKDATLPATDKERIKELESEVADLKEQIAAYASGLVGVPKELIPLVREKRAAGLDLKSAIESARNQIEWDASQKKKKND